jgi:hypothetical protein
MNSTNNTLCCYWCGISLSSASNIIYLNGNLLICDLCLIRAKYGQSSDTFITTPITKPTEIQWRMI